MKRIIFGLCVALAAACSHKDETDQRMIEQDLEKLKATLNSEMVLFWKFLKIKVRSSAETDPAKIEAMKKALGDRYTHFTQLSLDKHPTTSECFAFYRDYQAMKGYVSTTDEDIFPTLMESMPAVHHDPVKAKFLAGTAKEKAETGEHTMISLFALSSSLGKIPLYECSETNPDLLPDSENKALMRFYRGYLFFGSDLFYLSENELSKNIEMLEKNKQMDLQNTRSVLGLAGFGKEQTYKSMLAMNYLFRGLDRMMMDREIDDQRSMEDLEKFLKLSSELGMSNELTWSVEAYVHLKKGETDKAIVALTKLKNSRNLPAEERKVAEESIAYLQKRQPGKVLNGVYDKVFMAKIASGYVMRRVAATDWSSRVKNQKIPYANEAVQSMNTFKSLASQMEKYATGEMLEDAGNELKEKGEGLWDKAKGIFD